jgi:hypothetical protein
MTETPDQANQAVSGLRKAVDAAMHRYDDTYPLRALVAAVPYLGGPLDVLLSGRGQQIRNERLRQLIEDLQEETSALATAKVDRDFLESEDFYDWFVLLLEQALRTNHADKLRALRRVFVHGVTTEYSRGALKEIILRHVGGMSGAHVVVLGAVNNAIAERLATQPPPTPLEPRTEAAVELAQLRGRVRGLSQVEIDAIVNDLLAAGILEYYPPLGKWGADRQQVVLTKFGQSSVAFLREPSGQAAEEPRHQS